MVLVAHNEDEYGRFVVFHGLLPERDWDLTDPEQACLPAEDGLAAVPQAAHTYRAYWVENVCPEHGSSSSDTFYNQNGVLVTSNSGRLSKPDPKDPSLVKDGGIAYNLRRAIGERAESARHGVQVALSLLAEWGYASPARNYTIADKEEAWNIQVVWGHHYAAARIPDNGVMTLPNHLTIHNLKEFPVSIALDPRHPQVPMDADFSKGAILYPADLIENAIRSGWYQPRTPGNFDDFDYAHAYQASEFWKGDDSIHRHAREMQVILGKEKPECPPDPLADLHGDTDKNLYPFCVYPEKPVTVEQLAVILCSHFESIPERKTELGPGKSPHVRWGLIVCYGNATESYIVRMAEKPEQTTFYTAFGRSCHQPFMALHPLCGIPETLDPMADPEQTMRDHLKCQPERTLWKENAWWKNFRSFQELADLQFCALEEPLRRLREEHLRREKAANETILQSGGDLAAFDRERVDIALNEWKAFADRHFNTAEILPHEPVSRTGTESVFSLRFRMSEGKTPAEEGLILLGAMLDLGECSARVIPGTLKVCEEGLWTAEFNAEPVREAACCAGKFDYYLGGLDTDGMPFAGQLILELTD